jgi:glucose/arabinose dehydrogenase
MHPLLEELRELLAKEGCACEFVRESREGWWGVTVRKRALNCSTRILISTAEHAGRLGERVSKALLALDGKRKYLDAQKELRKFKKIRSHRTGSYRVKCGGDGVLYLSVGFLDAVSVTAALDSLEEKGLLLNKGGKK